MHFAGTISVLIWKKKHDNLKTELIIKSSGTTLSLEKSFHHVLLING